MLKNHSILNGLVVLLLACLIPQAHAQIPQIATTLPSSLAVVDKPEVAIDSRHLHGRDNAAVGVLYHNLPGVGVTNLRITNSLIEHCKVLVQAGVTPEEHNAAEMTVRDSALYHGTIGFRLVHDQGVNFRFDACNFGDLDTVFQIERGGAVHVAGREAFGCKTLLRTGAGGPNTGPISISDFRWEHSGMLLDAPDAGGGAIVSFNRLTVADPQLPVGTPFMRIGAHVRVAIRDSLLETLPPGTKIIMRGNGPKWPAVLIFDNVVGAENFTIDKNPDDVVTIR